MPETEYKLLAACDEGHVVEVERLLSEVSYPAAVLSWNGGKTLLHWAIPFDVHTPPTDEQSVTNPCKTC